MPYFFAGVSIYDRQDCIVTCSHKLIIPHGLKTWSSTMKGNILGRKVGFPARKAFHHVPFYHTNLQYYGPNFLYSVVLRKLLIIAAGNHKDSYISYNISKHMNLERNAYTYVCNYGKLLT